MKLKRHYYLCYIKLLVIRAFEFAGSYIFEPVYDISTIIDIDRKTLNVWRC